MLHPHDEALLYDLLDGRLAPAAADEVRRRIDDEPELRAAWAELGRLRAHLRALPTRAVPGDFVASVRARIGLPPMGVASNGSAHGDAPRVSALDGAVAPSTGDAPIEPVAAAPILRMRRGWMAAAATIGVALGAGVFWTIREGTPQVREAATSSAGSSRERGDTTLLVQPPAPYGAGRPEAKPGAGPAVPSGGSPRFGAPGGAVPSGLREPVDAPPPVSDGVSDSTGLPGAVPPPVPPPPAAPPVTAPPAPAPSGGGGGGATPVERRGGLPDGEAAMAEGMGPEPLAGPAAGPDANGGGPLDPTVGLVAGKRGVPRAQTTPAWAAEGVDAVLVLQADSLDAARAEIALLGDLRDPAVLARLRPRLSVIEALGCLAPELAGAPALEEEQVKAKEPGAAGGGRRDTDGKAEADAEVSDRRKLGDAGRGGTPSPSRPAAPTSLPPSGPAEAEAPVAPPAALGAGEAALDTLTRALAHPLGSLRIDLGDEAWRRLEVALAPDPASCTALGEKGKEAEKVAKDAGTAADDTKRPPPRRLRILIVPR